MRILGIETSCDETSAAVVDASPQGLRVQSHIISSQASLHATWGGVVPNLAAREHLKNILPVIEASLRDAAVTLPDIDLIAVTQGPGLIPALMIGVTSAKTLSYRWGKPLVGIHHIEGHIYANFADRDLQAIQFPLLALVVSGGHTQLILMERHLEYQIIGETLDDAVGEAFDKVARMLNLGYPGGPAISKMAAIFTHQHPGARATLFPRPMLNSPDFNFSFSGLKTAVLYYLKQHSETLADAALVGMVSFEFQQAALDTLIAKTLRAARQYHPRSIVIAGGVSANSELRRQLAEGVARAIPHTEFWLPDQRYTLDNAAMIAMAAYFRWNDRTKSDSWLGTWKTLEADSNLTLARG